MKNNYLRCLSVLMFTLLSISAFAQKTITGTVMENSAPVPGVSVTIKGTTRATHYIPKIAENLEIKISTLGDLAELYGAASLVMEHYDQAPAKIKKTRNT